MLKNGHSIDGSLTDCNSAWSGLYTVEWMPSTVTRRFFLGGADELTGGAIATLPATAAADDGADCTADGFFGR